MYRLVSQSVTADSDSTPNPRTQQCHPDFRKTGKSGEMYTAATLRAMRFESAWRRYVFVVGCFAVRVAEVIVDGSEAGERRNFFGDNSTNAGTSSSSSSSSPIGITPRRSFA